MAGVPSLRTLCICEDGQPDRHAAWCLWCETVHHHGSGGGHRAPHCADGTSSPLALTGYSLVVTASGKGSADARPRALMADGATLTRKLADRAVDLRGHLAAALLGVEKAESFVNRSLGPDHVASTAGSVWRVATAKDRRRVRDGYDLVSLAELLHGLPPGVISVRVLEAVTGLQLDARAALDVQAAIDAWVERGAPAGTGRRA